MLYKKKTKQQTNQTKKFVIIEIIRGAIKALNKLHNFIPKFFYINFLWVSAYGLNCIPNHV